MFPVLALVAAIAVPANLHAQKRKGEPELRTGTLVSFEKAKGKNYTLKMKGSDDVESEILVTPKTAFSITAKGDAGFLKPKLMVSAKLVNVNQKLFGKQFTVYMGPAPSAYVTQDKAAKDLFEVCGQIVAVQPDSITVNFPQGPQPVFLEAGHTIQVSSTDPALAKPDANVEVEGFSTRGGKAFNPVRIKIDVPETIKSAEYFAAVEEARTAKSGSKSRTSKTKGKTDEPVKSNDPFGLLDKKKSEAGDDAKPADGQKPDQKKTEDAKPEDSKPEEKPDEKEAGDQ